MSAHIRLGARPWALAALLGAVLVALLALAGPARASQDTPRYTANPGDYSPVAFTFDHGKRATVELRRVTLQGDGPATGTQTWTYRITSPWSPTIDSVEIGMAGSLGRDDLVAVSDWYSGPGRDGHDDRWALTLKRDWDRGETRDVTFTVRGWWPISDDYRTTVNAGHDDETRTVPAPGCPAPLPDLQITKTGPATAAPGRIDYTLTVTNTGTQPVDRDWIVVRDGGSVVPPPKAGKSWGGHGKPSTLNPGQSMTFTVTQDRTSAACGSEVTNTATVSIEDDGYVVPETRRDNNTATARTAIRCADLAIAKAGPDQAAPGMVDFTITVTNTGPWSIPVADIVVRDGDDVLANPDQATLEPGATLTYRVSYRAAPASCGGDLANTATVHLRRNGQETATPTPADDAASAHVAIVCPDVSIAKSGPAQAATGPVVFTITVTNTGPWSIPVADIVVRDGDAVLANPDRAALEPGGTLTYRVTRQADAASCGTQITNTATVRLIHDGRETASPTPADDTATARVALAACPTPPSPPSVPVDTPVPAPQAEAAASAPASAAPAAAAAPASARPRRKPVAQAPARTRLALDKRGPAVVRAGSAVRYRIVLRNVGRAVARDVVLRDVLPGGVSLVTRPRGAQLSGGTLTWRVGDLAPGGRRELTLVVQLDASAHGVRHNRATATAANAGRVADQVTTRIQAVRPALRPAVTG